MAASFGNRSRRDEALRAVCHVHADSLSDYARIAFAWPASCLTRRGAWGHDEATRDRDESQSP
ncbi:MAG: hypothetical protein IPL75_13160 [Acidobacteria bacterium]|nr:hypothetical protein [Acidobacteriota bacterium]